MKFRNYNLGRFIDGQTDVFETYLNKLVDQFEAELETETFDLKPEFNSDFWDCECKQKYIHKKSILKKCPKCGAEESTQPDSIDSEVEKARSKYQEFCGVPIPKGYTDILVTYEFLIDSWSYEKNPENGKPYWIWTEDDISCAGAYKWELLEAINELLNYYPIEQLVKERNEDFWNCECEQNYIKHKEMLVRCETCETDSCDQPDSIASEVRSCKKYFKDSGGGKVPEDFQDLLLTFSKLVDSFQYYPKSEIGMPYLVWDKNGAVWCGNTVDELYEDIMARS